MWRFVLIASLCVLIPSAYTQGFTPLKPPICGYSNVTLRRIVGGQPAKLGAWPWLTAVGFNSGNPSKPHWGCGGALISEQHVLTASHCVTPNVPYCVRIGDLDLNNDNDGARPFQSDIETIKKHPNYNANTLSNDIAILKLKKRVIFTSVLHPICLPVDPKIKDRNMDNLHAMVAGWGRTSWGGIQSSKLLQVQVPIISEERCKQSYGSVDSRVVCAGSAGKSTCQGDSGGPLMITGPDNQKVYYIIGAVSGAYKCAEPNYPTIYTRVTYFLDFVFQACSK